MSTKSPYEILGVPRDATPDQIRRAYLLKVKEIHPDNFDQTGDRARWELANEQLKELNEAYSILKNQESRTSHDEGAASAGRPPRRQRSPDWDIKLGKLKAGMVWFASLPKSVQDRILQRTTGAEPNQFAFPQGGIGWNYFFAVVLVGAWGGPLASTLGDRYPWSGDVDFNAFTGTLAASLLQAWNICHIVKWHKSPLRPHLIITPLYVIKTSAEQVWYWPIWSVTSVRATHNYTNSSYTGTEVNMEFGSDHQSFTIRPQAAYAQLCAMMDIFGRRVNAAKAQGDARYFHAEDDFREIDPESPPPEPPAPLRRNFKIFGITVAAYFALYLVAFLVNKQKATRFATLPSPARQAAPAFVPPPNPAPPVPVVVSPPRVFIPPAPVVIQPSYPEYPLPDNGETHQYGSEKQVARFVVSAGSDSHYWIKLVDASTGTPAIALFVRAGSKAEIRVPLGTYVIKYACGQKWYGTTHLFGPDTTYSKAPNPVSFYVEGNRVHGYSITLYKVPNGNLRTESISASEF
jgi:hypothetical protein